jgi:hypothetical protein
VFLILIGIITIGCSSGITSKTENGGIKENNQTVENDNAMEFSRKPPESWTWVYDIEPSQDHFESLQMPGWNQMRLSAYGSNKSRRFAAISFREPEIASNFKTVYLRDITINELSDKVTANQARPLSITADVVNDQLLYTLVLQQGAGPKTYVHVDLDESGLMQLTNPQHRISDFATYVVGGIRKYAVIVEERPGPSLVLSRVTQKELDATLRKHNVTPIRIRGFSEGGERYFTAIAERLDVGEWAWYDNIDADTVGAKLDKHNAYPFDLEAFSDERGVRFTVIMYRDRDK